MQHPDEGTIHALLDGQLPAAEAAALEAHVASCAECGARVAEARGLIAGSSRIVGALDHVPAGVIPIATRKRRRFHIGPLMSALAATIVLATGVLVIQKGHQEPAIVKPTAAAPQLRSDSVGTAPAPVSVLRQSPVARGGQSQPSTNQLTRVGPAPRPAMTKTATVAAPPPRPAEVAEPKRADVARLDEPNRDSIRTKSAAALPAEQAIGGVAAGARSVANVGAAGAAGASAGTRLAAAPAMAPAAQQPMADMTAPVAFCFEINESLDVLPRRFALSRSLNDTPETTKPVQYVDTTGKIGPVITDVSWTTRGVDAVIFSQTKGELLAFPLQRNESAARGGAGDRAARRIACHR